MYFVGTAVVFLFGLLALAVGIGLPILAAVLVYKDAKRRVDSSPGLWALVAGLAPCFVGVIVYLIVRKDYPLKPEYRTEQMYHRDYAGYSSTQYDGAKADSTGDEPDYGRNPAYDDVLAENKGMPTWAKALIIIGLVIAAIVLISAVVSLIKFFLINFTGYNPYSGMIYGNF